MNDEKLEIVQEIFKFQTPFKIRTVHMVDDSVNIFNYPIWMYYRLPPFCKIIFIHSLQLQNLIFFSFTYLSVPLYSYVFPDFWICLDLLASIFDYLKK